MGSGISLSEKQVVCMIERELERVYQEKENLRPRTTATKYIMIFRRKPRSKLHLFLIRKK